MDAINQNELPFSREIYDWVRKEFDFCNNAFIFSLCLYIVGILSEERKEFAQIDFVYLKIQILDKIIEGVMKDD